MSVRSIIRAQLDGLAGARPAPFDVHAHTGADIDGTVRSSEEHVADLAAVDGRSVVFPLCVTTGYRAENERVIAEARRYPERLVPFARLDPRVDSAAAASDALTAGARGFKLHPRGEDFRMEHPSVEAILGVAAEAGVPVLVHAGRGVGSFGPILTELAARHRDCPIILAHAGTPTSPGSAESSGITRTSSSTPRGGTRPTCSPSSHSSHPGRSSTAATRRTATSSSTS